MKSQRDYSRRFLSRGPDYLTEYQREDRVMMKVSSVTVRTLRFRLCAIAARVPAGLAAEIRTVVANLDQACRVADQIGRRR